MKNLQTLAGAALACGILAGCGPAKEELHIYTWSDYIAPEVIERFEKANNCKVIVDTFDSNEAMYAKLQAGSTGYDIIMPTSYQIPLMVKNKMVQKLDHEKLPNFKKNFDKGYVSATIDASFKYGVPYAVTYTGLAYRKDKVGDAPVDSWKVFEAAALKGRMSLLSDMRETIGGALKFLNYSLNSTSAEEINKAADVVIGWKKNIAKFDNEQYKTAVASGEWFVGHGYSSDVIQTMLDNENVGFSARQRERGLLAPEGGLHRRVRRDGDSRRLEEGRPRPQVHRLLLRSGDRSRQHDRGLCADARRARVPEARGEPAQARGPRRRHAQEGRGHPRFQRPAQGAQAVR